MSNGKSDEQEALAKKLFDEYLGGVDADWDPERDLPVTDEDKQLIEQLVESDDLDGSVQRSPQ